MNFINGIWKASQGGSMFKDANPADLNDFIGQFPDSIMEDAKEAIDAAKMAQEKWANVPAPQRGRYLLKASNIMEENLEQLARLLTREEGKPLKDSKGEVIRSIEILRFFAGLSYRLKGETVPSNYQNVFLFTIREPVGVASIITPWNFPIAIPVWKIAPALITGNTVVFKPSPSTPLIAQKLVEILEKVGIPKGVINLVQGGGDVGREMVVDKRVDVVSFTGSYATGSEIWKSRAETDKMIRYQLEMGGKNPLVVMADANLEKAAKMAVIGGFGLTGQACTSSSRIIVEEDVYSKFLDAFVNETSKFKVGNPLKHEDINMGPVINEEQLEKDLYYIRLGGEEGAKLLYGGRKLEDGEYKDGYYIQPTIYTDVTKDMRIAKEEIFGPVASVMKFKGIEEAIEIANSIDYGLCASVCTDNLNTAHEFINKVEAGLIKVNQPTIGLELHVPFGGYKKSSSSTFKEQCETALDIFTKIKTVYLSPRLPP